ncbi:MAG: hypothetical protein KAT65_10300, partial [Methanophagales archaeon]|nr:hypothetical protein [Methanophagales archaeon]
PKLRAMKIDNTSDKSGNNNLICEQCRRILCFKIHWTNFRVSLRKARKNGKAQKVFADINSKSILDITIHPFSSP